MNLPDSLLALRRGDIVGFRFPLAEDRGRPGPKARPCLALDVRPDPEGGLVAEVACGTDAGHMSNAAFDFAVAAPADRAAAGLDKPARFVLARTALAPVSPRLFALDAAGRAVLGRPPDAVRSLFERLDRQRLDGRHVGVLRRGGPGLRRSAPVEVVRRPLGGRRVARPSAG